MSCQEKPRPELPTEVGKGLRPADSLKVVIHWLSQRKTYEAETLRFLYAYELVRVLSRQNPDTLKDLLRTLEGWTSSSRYGISRGIAHLAWVEFLSAQGEYDSALTRAQEALREFKIHNRSDYIATSYNSLGILYAYQGQYAEALDYFYQSLQIREYLGDGKGVASPSNNIGLIYCYQGRYAEALEHFQRVRQIRERVDDPRGLADTYNNIGIVYARQGKEEQALVYYEKARQIREHLEDWQGLSSSYNNIGIARRNQGCYPEALAYFQKTCQIQKRIGDLEGLASTYNNIGNMYSDQKRYAEALAYYQQVYQIRKQLGDQEGLASCYYNIGQLYKDRGLYSTARMYFREVLAISHRLELNDLLKDTYLELALTDSILATAGQPAYWKTAYAYARLHTAYQDSVLNEESIRRQTQLEKQYEYDKRTALLQAEQEKAGALARAQIQRRELQRNLSLLALGIAVVGISTLLYFLLIIRRQKRQVQEVNRALAESNHIIQSQAEELKQKNADLEVFNAELEATNKALKESNQVIQAQAQALLNKNEEILASIRYAERIQRAILPSQEKWDRLLPDGFLIYEPKDIVAGDFYWLEETNDYIFLGIADATGHGVPGALVSLVCAGALNRAVREEGIVSPGQILTRARQLISAMLRQEGGKLRDGMDIALIRFEKHAPWRLRFSGANRPLWVMSKDGEFVEMMGTRQSVGYADMEKPFEEVEVDLAAYGSVTVYGFTDGVTDQMGGEQGRKLLSKGLRQALLEWHGLPILEQADRLKGFLREWRGGIEQMDDITLVGIRVG
jgi:serine phosphatase RsbU (regulator of sigma subunit)/tetratricopeptide (TPR) repeat protein